MSRIRTGENVCDELVRMAEEIGIELTVKYRRSEIVITRSSRDGRYPKVKIPYGRLGSARGRLSSCLRRLGLNYQQ